MLFICDVRTEPLSEQSIQWLDISNIDRSIFILFLFSIIPTTPRILHCNNYLVLHHAFIVLYYGTLSAHV